MKNNKGFGHTLVIAIALLIAIVGSVSVYVYRSNKSNNNSKPSYACGTLEIIGRSSPLILSESSYQKLSNCFIAKFNSKQNSSVELLSKGVDDEQDLILVYDGSVLNVTNRYIGISGRSTSYDKCTQITEKDGEANFKCNIEDITIFSASSAKGEVIQEALSYRPTDNCSQVITPATHKATGAKLTFNTGCLPPGWEADR